MRGLGGEPPGVKSRPGSSVAGRPEQEVRPEGAARSRQRLQELIDSTCRRAQSLV